MLRKFFERNQSQPLNSSDFKIEKTMDYGSPPKVSGLSKDIIDLEISRLKKLMDEILKKNIDPNDTETISRIIDIQGAIEELDKKKSAKLKASRKNRYTKKLKHNKSSKKRKNNKPTKKRRKKKQTKKRR